MNPFISSTDDALNRLQPGFEAPVATVTSLGYSVENATRNRSVLIGLVNNSKDAFDKGDLDKASKLIITLEKDMESLKEKYKEYERNILD